MTTYFIEPLQAALAKPYLKAYLQNLVTELNEKAVHLGTNTDKQAMLNMIGFHNIENEVLLMSWGE